MRRSLVTLAAVIAVLSLAACGDEATDAKSTPAVSEVKSDAAESTPTAKSTPPPVATATVIAPLTPTACHSFPSGGGATFSGSGYVDCSLQDDAVAWSVTFDPTAQIQFKTFADYESSATAQGVENAGAEVDGGAYDLGVVQSGDGYSAYTYIANSADGPVLQCKYGAVSGMTDESAAKSFCGLVLTALTK